MLKRIDSPRIRLFFISLIRVSCADVQLGTDFPRAEKFSADDRRRNDHGDFFRSQQSRRTDPHGGVQARYQMIQKKVAVFFPIRLADLKSKKRTQHTAFCRQVAVCLCRKMTDNSYPAIGEAFGRDHSR